MANGVPAELKELEGLREVPMDQVRISGVYFLCQNDGVLYVGQSVNLYARLSAHEAVLRGAIDGVYFIPAKDAEIYREKNSYKRPYTELDVVESKLIHKLRPPLNGRKTRSNKARINGEKAKMCAPMSEDLLAEFNDRNREYGK